MSDKKTLNVGVIGYGFMGKAHSNAYAKVNHFFPDLEHRPVLKAICGRNSDAAAEFDKRILRAFSDGLNFDLNPAQQRQAQLPRRHAGFDLVSAERGSNAAYTASWVLSLQGQEGLASVQENLAQTYYRAAWSSN